jgi:hypothetical protein
LESLKTLRSFDSQRNWLELQESFVQKHFFGVFIERELVDSTRWYLVVLNFVSHADLPNKKKD